MNEIIRPIFQTIFSFVKRRKEHHFDFFYSSYEQMKTLNKKKKKTYSSRDIKPLCVFFYPCHTGR
jgi:hypothetical protein